MAPRAGRALQRLALVVVVAAGLVSVPSLAAGATPAAASAVRTATAAASGAHTPAPHRGPRDASHHALRLPVAPHAAATTADLVLLLAPALLLIFLIRLRSARHAPVTVRMRGPPARSPHRP